MKLKLKINGETECTVCGHLHPHGEWPNVYWCDLSIGGKSKKYYTACLQLNTFLRFWKLLYAVFFMFQEVS